METSKENLKFRHLDKLPLVQYTSIVENFQECVSRLTKLAPFHYNVTLFVASWGDSHGIVIMDYFIHEDTLHHLFSGITCPYICLRQNLFLSAGKEVFGIQPSFHVVPVGCPIYYKFGRTLLQGTLGFFVRNHISNRVYGITCAHNVIFDHVIDHRTKEYRISTAGQVSSPDPIHNPSLLDYEYKKMHLAEKAKSWNPFKKYLAKYKLKAMGSSNASFLGTNLKAYLGAWLDKNDNIKKLVDLSIVDLDQQRVKRPNTEYFDVRHVEKRSFGNFFDFQKFSLGSFDDLYSDDYLAVAGSQGYPSFNSKIIQEGNMTCTWFPDNVEPLYCGVLKADTGPVSYAGDSGACIFNSSGNILGIIFAVSTGEDPFSFFMDIDSIRAFIGPDYELI